MWGISLLLCLAAFATLTGVSAAQNVTIDNLKPRLDTSGNIIDAHDGSVQQFGGKGLFFMHAVQYGLCKEPAGQGCDQTGPTGQACGFQFDHNITVYTTPDLSSGSWEFHGNALEVSDRPAGVVFRPHLVFNPNTKMYVLMWNWVSASTHAYMGNAIAVSPSPYGPFKTVVDVLNVTRLPGGDFDLLVDERTNDGYIVYSTGHWITIEKLAPDFLSSTGQVAVVDQSSGVIVPDSWNGAAPPPQPPHTFPIYFCEAPTFFERDGTYYALFGHCCCFCKQGSGLFVWTAPAPLGPWKLQSSPYSNVACKNATLAPVSPAPLPENGFGTIDTPGQGCLYGGSTQVSTTRSQQNFVIQVPTPGGTEYIYTGDRWQQSPDGIKGHDPQAWIPLQFGTDGSVEFVNWVDNFTMNVVVG